MVSSRVQAGPPKLLTQLFGGPPSPRPSAQTYQSRHGERRDEREAMNHGCWSLVWFGTRSSRTRMPRRAASVTRRSNTVMVPSSGSTAQKSATS